MSTKRSNKEEKKGVIHFEALLFLADWFFAFDLKNVTDTLAFWKHQ